MLHSHSVEPNKDDKVGEKAGGRVVNITMTDLGVSRQIQ